MALAIAWHEAVGLHGLVEVHRSQRLHIEAREPHGADEHDAQRVVRILELVVQAALLHLHPMRTDIEVPFLEVRDLVLLLADDDRHLRRAHPIDLPLLLKRLLLAHVAKLLLLGLDRLLPVLLDVVEHHHRGDLVHADEHRLAGLPDARVVVHEVLGDLAQARLGHDHVHAVAELAFDLLGLFIVKVGRFHCIHELLIELGILDAQLVGTVLVEERNRRAVLHRAVEVIDGNIAAEGATGEVVVFEDRRAGEADPGRRRQKPHHVLGADAVVGTVRLVGQDNDIVVRAYRLHVVLVELLDEREHVAGIAVQLLDQVLGRSWRGSALRAHQPGIRSSRRSR